MKSYFYKGGRGIVTLPPPHLLLQQRASWALNLLYNLKKMSVKLLGDSWEGRRSLPLGSGAPTYYLAKFFMENCMKIKKIVHREAALPFYANPPKSDNFR